MVVIWVNDRISVAEYAKRKGITKAAAYKQLSSNEYDQYLVTENGVKMVLTAIFNHGTERPQEKQIKKPALDTECPPQAAEQPQADDYTAAFIQHLKKENADLMAAIAARDEKISELSEKISEMAIQSQNIAAQALQTVGQAQYLQAVNTKKKGFFRKLLEGRKEE